MSIPRDFVLRALLQHNFFPMEKTDREELPPVLTSATFTPDVALLLANGKRRQADGYRGYDAVEYKITRFNGVPRSCSIPHPTAYAQLSLCIHSSWDKLDYICTNDSSVVRPRQHKDGRLIVMDYGSLAKREQELESSFGRRFRVTTDIANCFPSVYSHSIAWATVGFSYAKQHRPPQFKDEWFNQLDEKTRWTRRNETHGVPIGPATSNVVVEAILARVDEVLHKEGYVFHRYVDDYTCYSNTEEQARGFVGKLAEELGKYGFLINIKKTKITPLPEALAADWITELSLALPGCDELSPRDAVSYLNRAVQIAKAEPDGSVLKYALKSLMGQKLTVGAKLDVLRYALTLSFHQPVLLPLLDTLFKWTVDQDKFPYADKILTLALENAHFRRSDGMAWSLYYANAYKVPVAKEVADEIIASRDCMALLLLYLSGDAANQEAVVNFVSGLDTSDLYELDRYWLLLYELFFAGKIASPYKDENAFETMKDQGVSFVEAQVVNNT